MAANGLTGIKSELALHYQLMQNTLWFWSVPTDKKFKGILLLTVIFQLNSKATHFRTYVYKNFFSWFGVGYSILKSVQGFRCILYVSRGTISNILLSNIPLVTMIFNYSDLFIRMLLICLDRRSQRLAVYSVK
jgi:hypothetical protein